MLPARLWRDSEPRFGLPVFARCVNRVSQSVRTDFGTFNWKKAARAELGRLKRGKPPTLTALRSLLDSMRRLPVRIRGALTTREGELVHDFGLIGAWTGGQALEIDVNQLMAAQGIPRQDAMFIVIMDMGAHPEALTDLNIFSMSYESDRHYANYRTGAFARSLNDFAKKKHVGFVSVNPKITVDEGRVSSLLFINHSSNPAYDDTVDPTVRLYRQDGQWREAQFGPIRAFGGVERTIEDLFGPEVRDFLGPRTLGTTVTRLPGYTLASLSLLRSRDGELMAIEHTRATQSYLFNGI